MSEEKKSSKKTIIIIAVLALLTVGTGAFAAFLYFDKSNNKSNANATTKNVTANAATAPVSEKAFSADELVVNLADEGGKKYIKVNVALGYSNKKLDKELETKKPLIRDAINSVLRSKKAADFTPKGTEDMKKELLQKINPMFEKGQIENIYFSDILVQ